MPRFVRNFWVSASTTDATRAKPTETGPRSKDGGIYVSILLRENGSVGPRVSIYGDFDKESGCCVLTAQLPNGETVELARTQR